MEEIKTPWDEEIIRVPETFVLKHMQSAYREGYRAARARDVVSKEAIEAVIREWAMLTQCSHNMDEVEGRHILATQLHWNLQLVPMNRERLTRGQLAQALDEVCHLGNTSFGADADGDFMPMADAVIERLTADAILEVKND